VTEDEESSYPIRDQVRDAMRLGWFGPEPASPGGLRTLSDEVASCRDALVDVLDELYQQLADNVPAELRAATVATLAPARAQLVSLETSQPDRPFEIVLVGASQVGKSTLVDFLTGGDSSLIDNATESAAGRPERFDVAENLSIVDAPGIGGADAAHTREPTLAAARRADLVVWVFDSGVIDEGTASLMREIASSGRPVGLLGNVKASLLFRSRSTFIKSAQHAFTEFEPSRELARQVLTEMGQTPVFDTAANLALLNLSRILRIRRVSQDRIYSAFQLVAPQSEWINPKTKKWNRPELLDNRGVITRWAKGQELLAMIEAAQSGALDSLRDFSLQAGLRQFALEVSATCAHAAGDLLSAASEERSKPVEVSGRILGRLKTAQGTRERERSATAIERMAHACADAAATAADSVRTLDAQLYRSLLARARRWRLRDGLAAVSREPGRGALIAFTDDDLFSEANLFAPAWVPDWVGVEPWRPTPNPGNTTGVIAHALQVGRWPGCTIAVTAEHIGVHLTSQAVPDAEPMWADLAQDLIAGGGPSPTVSILAIDTGTARPQPPAQTANLQTGPHVG